MLSGVLWNFQAGNHPAEIKADPPRIISLESEIRRSHGKAAQSRIDLNRLLAAISSESQTLGAQRNIDIEIAAAEQPIWLEIDRTLLRQALLCIISALLDAASTDSTIHLNVQAANDFNRVVFIVNDSVLDGSRLRARLESQDTLTMLVQTLNAQMVYRDGSGGVSLSLEIPSNLTVLLVIDDNPDLVDLFRRYLHNQSYALYASQDAEVAIQ